MNVGRRLCKPVPNPMAAIFEPRFSPIIVKSLLYCMIDTKSTGYPTSRRCNLWELSPSKCCGVTISRICHVHFHRHQREWKVSKTTLLYCKIIIFHNIQSITTCTPMVYCRSLDYSRQTSHALLLQSKQTNWLVDWQWTCGTDNHILKKTFMLVTDKFFTDTVTWQNDKNRLKLPLKKFWFYSSRNEHRDNKTAICQ